MGRKRIKKNTTKNHNKNLKELLKVEDIDIEILNVHEDYEKQEFDIIPVQDEKTKVYSIKNYKQPNVAPSEPKYTALIGDKATASSFIVYFTYETTVTYKNGGAEKNYEILPGAYLIDMKKYQTMG